MEAKQFAKEINETRLSSKGRWYQWTGTVYDNKVALKGYKTWIQVLKVYRQDNNGEAIKDSNSMDESVTDFKSYLLDMGNYIKTLEGGK